MNFIVPERLLPLPSAQYVHAFIYKSGFNIGDGCGKLAEFFYAFKVIIMYIQVKVNVFINCCVSLMLKHQFNRLFCFFQASIPIFVVAVTVVAFYLVYVTRSYKLAIFTIMLIVFAANFGITWYRMYQVCCFYLCHNFNNFFLESFQFGKYCLFYF